MTACAIALAAATALLTPGPAFAGQLVVRPLQLRPLSNRQPSYQDDLGVGGLQSVGAIFTAPLRLPAGARIRGLRYEHASPDGSSTVVGIMRVRPGAVQPVQTIISGGSSATTPALYEFTTVVGAFKPGAVRRVQAGWRYAIVVSTLNDHARVGRVRVLY